MNISYIHNHKKRNITDRRTSAPKNKNLPPHVRAFEFGALKAAHLAGGGAGGAGPALPGHLPVDGTALCHLTHLPGPGQ